MTKIVNLDELRKPTPVVIIVDGKRHQMQPATVETFLENMKAIEELGVNATPSQEIEVMIGIITRGFPDLKEKQIRSWTLDQLRALSELARGANDEIVSDDEKEITEAAKSGNVQKAD